MIPAEPSTTRSNQTGRAMMDRTAGRLALAAATFGIVAGVLDMVAGGSIRAAVGNKLDTTGLGLATALLSAVALVAAVHWLRPGGTGSERRLGTVLALLLVGCVCFTTIGWLWVLPGTLLLIASGLILARSARWELTDAVDENRWWTGLTAMLGGYYVLLGADTLPKATGLVGIASGLAIWGALRLATRSRRLAVGLLVVGALAFAIVTWWSVVTPVAAMLVVTIGPVALKRRHPNGRRPRSVRLPAAAQAGTLI
jgi:hypothetical protein